MIEEHFDVPFVAWHALREKQIQQTYRPIIAVHKWFARRPGTLFRGLILSEFCDQPLSKAFSQGQQLSGLRIADPFMGGGTPLIEANRLGCDVTGFDINPIAYWIVREELQHLDVDQYRAAAQRLVGNLANKIGHLYKTTCIYCGRESAVKYFLWVKQRKCPKCDRVFDLWPGYLLAKNTRHTAYVIVCGKCGHLNEVDDLATLDKCFNCTEPLTLKGTASRGEATCPHCQSAADYPSGDVPRHRLFALEYHCEYCRSARKGRFFKSPDDADIARIEESQRRAKRMTLRFAPDDEIPPGDETNRLIRWGYRRYRDMFNPRQLMGLELSCREISRIGDERIRNALATNLSDLLRYQNMLCRYDTMALKSLDVFSVHGFPVSLIQCESNILGIPRQNGSNVGSGGWTNIVAKYAKAKEYCDRPFEMVRRGKKAQIVVTEGEWIGDRRNPSVGRAVDIRCVDAASERLAKESLDAVFTDPPYFGNVQYAELMDFCYVWLKRLVGDGVAEFRQPLTRNRQELTGNTTEGRDIVTFTEGLSQVLRAMANALKPRAPLAFTFHHNSLSAYAPVGVAILDSRLSCTATFPCPAEMGGSIHISGTGSSIVDTIFVCRKGVSHEPVSNPESDLVAAMNSNIADLVRAGHAPTDGDINCMLFGHLTRLAIAELQACWNREQSTRERLDAFEVIVGQLAVADEIKAQVNRDPRVTEDARQKTLFDVHR